MFDSSGICEAIRLLVQSKLKLTANCAASATVQVGSTEMFRPTGARPVYPITGLTISASLLDSDTAAEAVVIDQITDLTTLVLYQACAGTFTTANNATIELATPRVTLGSAGYVVDGWSGFSQAITGTALPAIAVIEEDGTMPGERAGTNVQYDQFRTWRILYARRRATDEQSEQVMKQAIQALCNLIMEDYTLGGSVRQRMGLSWSFTPPQRTPFLMDFDAVDVGQVMFQTVNRVLWDK